MAITKRLTEGERDHAAAVAKHILQMCESCAATGHPYAAVQLAKHGQFFARLAYRRGQLGWDMFQTYLR